MQHKQKSQEIEDPLGKLSSVHVHWSTAVCGRKYTNNTKSYMIHVVITHSQKSSSRNFGSQICIKLSCQKQLNLIEKKQKFRSINKTEILNIPT